MPFGDWEAGRSGAYNVGGAADIHRGVANG